MKKYPIFILTILMFYLCGCVHKYDFYMDKSEDTTIVVEGLITNENSQHFIKISHMTGLTQETPQPISKAFVAVTTQDSTFYFEEDTLNPGTYLSKHKFVGVAGSVYYLHIEINKTVYSAESTMLPVTPPEKITFLTNESGEYYISHVAESFVKENPAMYILDLNWQKVSGYENLPEKDVTAKLYYYSLTTVDVSQLFAPKRDDIYFPKGTQIIEKKYSLDANYELFIRSLLAETRWSGGYFDEAHGNLHSNITNGTGYFATCTVYTDTIYVE
ncbi:MAG: DUF4249 domain-containing protein [Bacteroidales bacterium]|nr:DUF4249 domain-containing protein [Bacteroidales bacterium]